MSKVLCTGMGGVVGNALLPLLKKNTNIKTLDIISNINNKTTTFYYGKYFAIDLLYKSAVEQLIKYGSYDVVFHFAAISTSSSSAEKVWGNTTMTLNLLEAIAKQEKKVRFIQASSILSDYQTSVYAVSKAACERLLSTYKNLYPYITGASIKFPAVVGLGATHGLLPDVIKKCLTDSETIELWGARPGSCKPFIYNKNLAKMIYEIGLSDQWDVVDPISICPSLSISVEEVAKLVMAELNVKKKIEWNESKVWKGDNNFVESEEGYSIFSHQNKYYQTSEEAIILATRDIIQDLKKDNR